MPFLALFQHSRRSVPKFLREVQKTSSLVADPQLPPAPFDRFFLVEGGLRSVSPLGMQWTQSERSPLIAGVSLETGEAVRTTEGLGESDGRVSQKKFAYSVITGSRIFCTTTKTNYKYCSVNGASRR